MNEIVQFCTHAHLFDHWNQDMHMSFGKESDKKMRVDLPNLVGRRIESPHMVRAHLVKLIHAALPHFLKRRQLFSLFTFTNQTNRKLHMVPLRCTKPKSQKSSARLKNSWRKRDRMAIYSNIEINSVKHRTKTGKHHLSDNDAGQRLHRIIPFHCQRARTSRVLSLSPDNPGQ